MSHKIPRFAFPMMGAGQVLSHGMTLRDYMAAKVLPAIYAEADGAEGIDHIAQKAYAVADAMLDARCHGAKPDV